MFPFTCGTAVLVKDGSGYQDYTFVLSWNDEVVQLSNGMKARHADVSVYEISAWHIAEYLLARDGLPYYINWLRTPAGDQVHTLTMTLADKRFICQVKELFGGKVFNNKDIRTVAIKVIAYLKEEILRARQSKH
jgi:hypothetical protein